MISVDAPWATFWPCFLAIVLHLTFSAHGVRESGRKRTTPHTTEEGRVVGQCCYDANVVFNFSSENTITRWLVSKTTLCWRHKATCVGNSTHTRILVNPGSSVQQRSMTPHEKYAHLYLFKKIRVPASRGLGNSTVTTDLSWTLTQSPAYITSAGKLRRSHLKFSPVNMKRHPEVGNGKTHENNFCFVDQGNLATTTFLRLTRLIFHDTKRSSPDSTAYWRG